MAELIRTRTRLAVRIAVAVLTYFGNAASLALPNVGGSVKDQTEHIVAENNLSMASCDLEEVDRSGNCHG